MYRKLILGLVFLLVLSSFVSADLTTNIEAYYKFDGDATDSVVSNDGSVSGAISGSSYGKIDEGYSFDGTNDYIDLGDITDTNTDFSVSAWVNLQSKSVSKAVWSIGDTSNSNYYKIGRASCRERV